MKRTENISTPSSSKRVHYNEEIEEYVDAAMMNEEDHASNSNDILLLKKMILSLEKAIQVNCDMRMKHKDDPKKYKFA